jgi:signal peptidase complex subunit 2
VIKVEKWDWNAVKNALDDATRKFITSQKGFKEDHSLLNMRLLISTVAILISLYGIYDDWVHPFPASKQVLIICVIAYFATLTILTLYTAFVEKGVFTAAKQFDETGLSKPNKWKFTSKQIE